MSRRKDACEGRERHRDEATIYTLSARYPRSRNHETSECDTGMNTEVYTI